MTTTLPETGADALAALVPQLLGSLDMLGVAVKALIDTRLLCAVCVREQIAAAQAGVGQAHLPPVNIANLVENGESRCGNHLGANKGPTLFLPSGYSR